MSLLAVLLVGQALASAAPAPSLGFAFGALPARQSPATLAVSITDSTGARWDWTRSVRGSVVTPGLVLRADLRWPRLSVGIDAALALASFADEGGKTGRTYGAAISLPVGYRVRTGAVELGAFAGPALILGGYGFGGFARKAGAPITFGEIRFYDDETALHLLETSLGLSAGVEARAPLGSAATLFVQLGGLAVLHTSRMYNIAGYADEARTRVEWYRRPLDAPEISASFDGQPFTAGASVFGFDGPRIIAGVEFAL